MLWPCHDDQRFRVEQFEGHAVHHRWFGHPPDGEIDFARLQGREQFRVGCRLHSYPGVRAAPPQARDGLREEAASHRGQRAHLDGGDARRSGPGESRGGRLVGLRDVDRVSQELLAGLRQLSARASPLDQLAASQGLELGQRLGDRGLAQVQSFRRAGERPLLGDDYETAEVPEPDARQSDR